MNVSTTSFLRASFPPPSYVLLKTVGLDLASGSMKYVSLLEKKEGCILEHYGSHPFERGVIEDGDIVNGELVTGTMKRLLSDDHMHFVQVALPEQKSYLFTLSVNRGSYEAMKAETAGLLEGYVPLPPHEVVFDIHSLGRGSNGKERIVGVAYARRIVSVYKEACEKAGLFVRGMEPEMFATARSVIRTGDTSTSLIVDLGKTSTKLIVTEGQIPVYTVTLSIGGHSLTQAVQKHLGVTEEEASQIKIDKGISLSEGELLESLLSTLSAIREEVSARFNYWQKKAREEKDLSPIEHVYLVGGNANMKGLPEYLMASLGVPVSPADVFVNLAPFDVYIPDIEKRRSLTYASAIGLALRTFIYD